MEISGKPRIKLSNEITKVTIPGRKKAYRLVGADGVAMLDFMIGTDESAPSKGRRTLCRHPFDEKKRAYVTPTEVIPLHRLVWDGEFTKYGSFHSFATTMLLLRIFSKLFSLAQQ